MLFAAVGSASCRTAAPRAPETAVTLVQPGAPGEATRVITAAEASDLSRIAVTAADVQFMQSMIGHHQQAVEMVALIDARTTRDSVRMLGQRIAASQEDEIALMRQWLQARGHDVPGAHAHHGHGAPLMPGMLTPEEMARLAAARGTAFDHLFLEGMIKHHGGAIAMVQQLYAAPAAGQEVEIFTFAADVDSDQRIEIDRMASMLNALLEERRP